MGHQSPTLEACRTSPLLTSPLNASRLAPPVGRTNAALDRTSRHPASRSAFPLLHPVQDLPQ
jgi:hypothetical protein